MAGMLKLSPFYSEKVWGYEKWNLSTHKNGYSGIEGSDDNLIDVIGKELPILIKIICANENLSVQVHPDDMYANRYECDNGKMECWYVLEADDDAKLICGIVDGHDRHSFSDVIYRGELENNLRSVSVNSGDMIYIPSGTVHAIYGGIKVVEVQQSSDVTYRMYDWGRDREMHIEKALDVIDYNGINSSGKIDYFEKLETPYFTIDKVIVNGVYSQCVGGDFEAITVVSGEGFIIDEVDKIKLNKEDTMYLFKNTKYKISGNLEIIRVYLF